MESKKVFATGIIVVLTIAIALVSFSLFYDTLVCISYAEDGPSRWIRDSKIHVSINLSVMESEITITFRGVNLSDCINGIRISRCVDTGSMEPLIFGGTRLIVLRLKDKDLINPGDIITFSGENKSIVHRVIEKKYEWNGTGFSPCFRTKGDNNKHADSRIVRADNVTGVVVGIIY